MYTDYYGLTETPFKIIPDPRFLWYSDQHKEAKAKIEYHLSQKDGPVYLSADVGTGKTSIAQRLRDEFATDKKKKVVLAFAPNLKTANQFLRFIADEFEVKNLRDLSIPGNGYTELCLPFSFSCKEYLRNTKMKWGGILKSNDLAFF